jgi:protein-disulfide isomerase
MMLQRRALLFKSLVVAGAMPMLARARPVAAASVEPRTLGDPGAPVTIIEYASLTCPHCATFHTDTLPGLKERYIESGKVKLEFHDFPLDQVALKAAIVAHCAGPDRYFAFLQALFDSQQQWSHASDPVAALKQIAALGGLSASDVDACLADKSMEDAVLQSRLAGQDQHDIRSTPTFIIDGKKYPGNRSVEEFAGIIDPLLPS